MFDFPAVTLKRIFVLICIAALTACGDDRGGVTDQQSLFGFDESYEITGAGIKGPLAYANVTIYALDTNFDAFYDPNKPVSSATTNAYAEIKGLKVRPNGPADRAAPYVLVIDGANAIDLNTNTAPVIKKLITIITVESLNAKQPVYATPYTTLAYHMLRQDIPPSGEAGSERGIDPLLATRLSSYNQEIIQALGFGIPAEINIFTTPPIITKDTTSVAQQQRVVYYRAAIEALSAIAHEMSRATGSTVTTDAVIQNLALDLHSDSMLDGAANGSPISGININTLAQNPMFLDIPNTDYLVSDTPSLIVEERALVGASANVTFFDDDITFDLYPLNLNAGDSSIPAGDSSIPAGDSSIPAGDSSIPAGDSSIPAGDSSIPAGGNDNPGDYLLDVDFNNRAPGAYAWADIKTDFQVDMLGYNDTSQYVSRMSLAADPADSGRGTVMTVYRPAGQGWAGMQFRADFQKVYDVYFAYDMYLDADHEFMKAEKNPGLMYMGYSDVGHPDYDTVPTPAELQTWAYTVTADGQSAWGRGGDGALSSYYYDKEAVQRNHFWDEKDPTWDNYASDSTGGNQYYQPRGRWITVETRIKMNTVTQENVSGLKDGLAEVWVTDPVAFPEGTRKVSSHFHKWRVDSSIGIDGVSMAQFYGGDGNDPANQPSKDQYHYYDNFRVSTNPITH